MGISRLPFASFLVGALILTLSACGGEPITFNGNPGPTSVASSSETESSSSEAESSSSSELSSSSQSVTSNSSSSSTSSVGSTSSLSSSSSSRSSSSSSSAAPTGRDLYTSARLGCSTCHGVTGGGGTTTYKLIPDDWDTASLVDTITTSMPPRNEPAYTGVTCDATCAGKISAYILSNFTLSTGQPNLLLKQSAAAPTYALLSSSEANCGVAFSSNDLRRLTRQEYSAALFQLTGIDLIGKLGQSTYDALPPDSISDSNNQKAYSLVASKIVDDLSLNNFADINNCANLSSEQCYSQLVDDFACKAFRRPLTSAERSDYLAAYSTSIDNQAGINKVVSAILSSANFTYRSNIGLALVNREISTNPTLALASAVSLLKDSKTLHIDNNTSVSANFSGSDLLEVSVKSTQNANGLWPVLRIQVGESTFVDLIANKAEASYKFQVTGVTGTDKITITNQRVNSSLEYQTGHSLVISSVKLALSY